MDWTIRTAPAGDGLRWKTDGMALFVTGALAVMIGVPGILPSPEPFAPVPEQAVEVSIAAPEAQEAPKAEQGPEAPAMAAPEPSPLPPTPVPAIPEPPPPEPPPPEPPPPEPPPPEPAPPEPAPPEPVSPLSEPPPPEVSLPPPPKPVLPPPPKPAPPRPAPPRPAPPRQAAPVDAPAGPAARPATTPNPGQATMPSPAASAARPSSAGAEGAYVGQVRSYIRSITKYPTAKEVRLTRPQGSVELRFTIGRNGEALSAEIIRSSGNLSLDGAARSTVRGGSYPPMPPTAWPGESSHSFTVTVEFVAPE